MAVFYSEQEDYIAKLNGLLDGTVPYERLYVVNTNTQEVQFDGGSGKRWRWLSNINGAADGSMVLQHTTDGFVANFLNALTVDSSGNLTALGGFRSGPSTSQLDWNNNVGGVLNIYSDSQFQPQVNLNAFTSLSSSTYVVGTRARGTRAAPSAAINGDNTVNLLGAARNAAGSNSNVGLIGIAITAAESSSQFGGSIVFQTSRAGVGLVEAVRIDHNGNVGIGVTANSFSPLHVRSGTAAFGMLRLEATGVNGESSIAYMDSADDNSHLWVVGKNVGRTDDAFTWYYNGTQAYLATNGYLALTGGLNIGGVPEKNEFGSTKFSTANGGIILKQGTAASPKTDATYLNAPLYIERYTNNSSTSSWVDEFSHAQLSPAHIVEVIVGAAEHGAAAAIAGRVTTSSPVPTGGNCMTGGVFGAYSMATTGTHRDAWGANIIACFDNNPGSTAAKPANCVALELDVLNGLDSTTGLPGGGNSNFTGLWIQASGANNAATTNTVATAGIYISHNGPFGSGTSGWRYGIIINANCLQYAQYIANLYNNSGAHGVFIQTAYTGASGAVLECYAGANPQLQVTTEAANPIYIMVNSTVRNVVAGAADSGGTGFRMLRVAN